MADQMVTGVGALVAVGMAAAPVAGVGVLVVTGSG